MLSSANLYPSSWTTERPRPGATSYPSHRSQWLSWHLGACTRPWYGCQQMIRFESTYSKKMLVGKLWLENLQHLFFNLERCIWNAFVNMYFHNFCVCVYCIVSWHQIWIWTMLFRIMMTWHNFGQSSRTNPVRRESFHALPIHLRGGQPLDLWTLEPLSFKTVDW